MGRRAPQQGLPETGDPHLVIQTCYRHPNVLSSLGVWKVKESSGGTSAGLWRSGGSMMMAKWLIAAVVACAVVPTSFGFAPPRLSRTTRGERAGNLLAPPPTTPPLRRPHSPTSTRRHAGAFDNDEVGDAQSGVSIDRPTQIFRSIDRPTPHSKTQRRTAHSGLAHVPSATSATRGLLRGTPRAVR
jgi:hypothetical protein